MYLNGESQILFKIITLFPEFFNSPLKTSLLGKAVDKGIIKVNVFDLKDFSEDKLRRCDDYPYGGGSGMVLKPEPLFNALSAVKTAKTRVMLTTPSGRLLNQDFVKNVADEEEICIVCGHYEGVDQRVIDSFIDDEVSIGDYILSGGEYAALVIIDAVSRNIPGFMSNPKSLEEESFEMDLLEYPQYTRPFEFNGIRVPEILLGGNHAKIEEWRFNKRKEKTGRIRPDLFEKYINRK